MERVLKPGVNDGPASWDLDADLSQPSQYNNTQEPDSTAAGAAGGGTGSGPSSSSSVEEDQTPHDLLDLLDSSERVAVAERWADNGPKESSEENRLLQGQKGEKGEKGETFEPVDFLEQCGGSAQDIQDMLAKVLATEEDFCK